MPVRSRAAFTALCLACVLAPAASAWGAEGGEVAEAHDMRLVGRHGLHGRSAYQPVIHEQDGRWLLYIGHHAGRAANPLTGRTEASGTTLIDVTDPARPRFVSHVPGEPGGGAQMVRVCSGRDLPRADRGRVYMLRTYGHSAHEVWDVTDPEMPRRLTIVADGLRGTHKNWWECNTGVAYLVSGVPGWRTSRMTQVFDLGDPRKPVFVRNFGLPGHEPGAEGPVPVGLHGPISTGLQGNRIYFGYGTNSGGVLQIVDRHKLLKGPRKPTRSNLLFAQVGRFDLGPDYGAHTAFPVIGLGMPSSAARPEKRDFVVVTNEALAEGCSGPRQKVWMIDVTDEATPVVASTWQLDDKRGGFCARPGRVGAHSSHESFTSVYYRRIMFIAHFNAGVRAIDIRDPYRMREIAHFVPESRGHVVATNNVEVDDRGYVYIVDRGSLGLHILALTGEARRAANMR